MMDNLYPPSSNMPTLSVERITAVNTIAAWLAVDDFSAQALTLRAEVIILAGNAVLSTVEGACQLAKTHGIPLLITGGIGHSTAYLQQAVARHPRYGVLSTGACSEAAILHAIATAFWHLPDDQILLETASKNTGENASFARALLDDLALVPQNVILIQDPVLQRRTSATFRQAWRNAATPPAFINWPTYIPRLVNTHDGMDFAGVGQHGRWPVDRFLSLLMGEIPRLRDDQHGYGPQGQNFICHVDIPAEVEQAWQMLKHHPALSPLWLDRTRTG